VRAVVEIALLTFREASRRRLVLVGITLGVAFVALYGTALWLVLRNAPCGPMARPCATPFQLAQYRGAVNILALAGLYVANLLTLATAVLLPVDTLSGEIASGVAETLASKPIHRAEIVLGKWAAYFLLVLAFLLVTSGGILGTVWVITRVVTGGTGFVVPGAPQGLPIMLLAATVMLTVSVAGGSRLSTVTNGMVAFGIFGLGFLGGWLEQIGEFVIQTPLARQAIRDVGTIVSLLTPADALWRLAASHMMPPIARDLPITPFSSLYPPSTAMVVWGIGYAGVTLLAALRWFGRRPL
jgi:hypothetical protein